MIMTASFHIERFNTPTGRMLIVTDAEQRLCAADWEDHEERLRRLFAQHYRATASELGQARRASAARRALDAYFEGDLDAIDDVPTATIGSDFQRRVWAALRLIPVGSTLSYGALAASLGRPAGARAVGMANGANPIAIVVPCHRVIGANAALTGYGGGLERKRWLLIHEGAARP
jgi:methylated-DNA-[protein]-cysteine S-methyltransferase